MGNRKQVYMLHNYGMKSNYNIIFNRKENPLKYIAKILVTASERLHKYFGGNEDFGIHNSNG